MIRIPWPHGERNRCRQLQRMPTRFGSQLDALPGRMGDLNRSCRESPDVLSGWQNFVPMLC